MIITTNIRLPEEQWKALKIRAVHAGSSVSELLRRAVAQILLGSAAVVKNVASATKTKRLKKQDPFFGVIGLGKGGPSDDSTHHDTYLYGPYGRK